jgi:hypothetical protein
MDVMNMCYNSEILRTKPHLRMWGGIWICRLGRRYSTGATPLIAYDNFQNWYCEHLYYQNQTFIVRSWKPGIMKTNI